MNNNTNPENLLSIRNLTIHYITDDGTVRAVNGIDLDIAKGETLGLVGETGAGKTTTALGIMRLIPDPPGKIVAGEMYFNGVDLLKESERKMRAHRGSDFSMIFQDPMTSLNPVITIGEQIAEVVRLHNKISKAKANTKAAEMLEMVGIPAERISDYPHQFSGGMKQRVVIAIALACNPHLIIADEPTTALDVTIQAQVLALMGELRERLNTAMLLITHDLGVVAEICDKVAIMYAGEIMEYGTLEDIYNHVCHPYTKGLFGSLPSLSTKVHRLNPISGLMPDPSNLPEGCPFNPRCPHCSEKCKKLAPPNVQVTPGHYVRCHLFASGREE
ncbi:Oligopeptide transport ATP-binding protein OppD [bioreactor metagenome]|uniref:Nickel import system ATP-binding protein NikD n=1 Tax=bioreactor metagenome TaxID=1076179 RepID=A0A645A287_9ZZZZ